MPLLRLIAEGVGPFEHLDIDLSDGKGNPHLGPHIFAGVNGSGKSTVLRTIAWVMSIPSSGFHDEDWVHLLTGYPVSRALAIVHQFGEPPGVRAWSSDDGRKDLGFVSWVTSVLADSAVVQGVKAANAGMYMTDERPGVWHPFPSVTPVPSIAAYSPSRTLRHLAAPDITKKLLDPLWNSLAFEGTAQNEAIQSWMLGLSSRRALARERQQSGEKYARVLGRLERALAIICGQNVSLEVEIEPSFQLRLRVFGKSLDFSQLPDGLRSTVAWIADFMMRQDLIEWDPRFGGKRPGVLLLDEVDTHLHPLWQRRLLPAMREALPDVQILVTSHSPFVISSCPGSRVHVLDVDGAGHARVRFSEDAPIGESVTTTLKEIFGVDSRFDVLTERQLDEWNTLKKREVAGSLTATDKSRFEELTVTLASRSEELRSIVAAPLTIPETVLRSLTARETKPHPIKRRKRA